MLGNFGWVEGVLRGLGIISAKILDILFWKDSLLCVGVKEHLIMELEEGNY